MNQNAPLFVIGTERSGSNLLRLMLNAHPRISVPHPPHILHYFAPLERGYGDLQQDRNFARLVRDVLRLVKVHIHPWAYKPQFDYVLKAAAPRDALGIKAALYRGHMHFDGKARWGCKSTFVVHHVKRVVRAFPDARFLWLIRDPRDVAVSSRISVFNPFHRQRTAQLWTREQRLGLAAEASLGPARLKRVYYEELIADPAAALRAISAFLGEDYSESMLRYYEGPDARRGAALSASWANVARPVNPNNAGRFRTELSDHERALVEAEAGDVMNALGYPLEHPPLAPRWRLAPHAHSIALDYALRLRVEAHSLMHERNHWRRWARRCLLTWLQLVGWHV